VQGLWAVWVLRLYAPAEISKAMRMVQGQRKCDSCAGSGKIAFRAGNSIEPHIFVLGSERVPSPIFTVAMTGARWRYLPIADSVLRRSPEAQLGYVAWRCRTHYRDTKGLCLCFGRITRFQWVKSRGEAVLLDIHGRLVSVNAKPPTPGVATITVGNKSLSMRRNGTLKIDAVNKTASSENSRNAGVRK
jgi:hypothetical protein